MAKIIPLREDETFYATCPECGGQEWCLPVNGPDTQWDEIQGSVCANPECEYFIEWLLVVGKGEECKDG
jgi:hypothetical protein